LFSENLKLYFHKYPAHINKRQTITGV